MTRKFIFIKDVENLLKQGKTEMQVPEGSRLSAAAQDLIREKGIQVSFTDAASAKKSENPEVTPSQQTIAETVEPFRHRLIAVASGGRDITGAVGKSAAKEPFFLIFDIKGRYIDVIKNPYTNDGDEVDPLIAKLMASSQVTAIVAETFGSGLRAHLEAKKVRCFETSGRIQETVKMVIDRKI